ncbi:MAG: FAD-binding protein [Bacillota bacterium]|nr:FAD-binding protein [Bacillota bacterium]
MEQGLTHPASMCGVFVGESNLAAPAGVLRNNRGDIILEKMDNLTRAALTNAMAKEISQGGGTRYGGLLLDLRPNISSEEGMGMWRARMKRGQFDAVRLAYGEAAFRWEEPWDVAPAHYFMGGVKVNTSGESSVRGLYAAGQAMGGIHGGNRLGSVSLAELFVFGFAAGEAAARESKSRVPLHFSREKFDNITGLIGRKGSFSPLKLQRRLQKTMWERVGITRHEADLQVALKEIEEVRKDFADVNISPHKLYNRDIWHALELQHMLTAAELITRSALLRQETRGAHFRLDFPHKDEENWRRNIVVFKEEDKMKIYTEAV